MYVVVDRINTDEVVHINPAPLMQNLPPPEIYSLFDPQKHAIAKYQGDILPERWFIDDSDMIQEMTLEQLISKGIVIRHKGLKAVGNKWVELTLEEKVQYGDLILDPNQKVVNGVIVKKTLEEMYEDSTYTLDQYKEARIQEYSQMSFELRRAILADYKLENAALGIYDEQERIGIVNTVKAFRDEFYRIRDLIIQSQTMEEILLIEQRFPTQLVLTS